MVHQIVTELRFSYHKLSLRNQPTLRDATSDFPILLTSHYPDLGSVSDATREICFNLSEALPRSLWVVTRHQYGISVNGFGDRISNLKPQRAKKIIFTACHSGKLKLAFTRPDVISTSPKNVLTSRIDFIGLLLFEFLKKHHLPVGQVKNRIH